MLRIAPRMMVVLLCGTMLAACSTTSSTVARLTGGETATDHAKKEVAAAAVTEKTAPTDLEGGIRQAQLMRVAGHYDDAIHVLSQLMLVASDDPRVVSEYGKTLAQKGRAQDAVEFLNRAIELTSNDWTLYSALGVSYDQLGNQTSARVAYEHALALRPEEPSVLNNYALSRMLANDPEGAHILIGRAERAGGASDAKIASNIAMLDKLAPEAKQNVAAAPVKPVVAASMPQPMPQNMPRPLQQNMQPRPAPVAQNMPRPIAPSMPVRQAAMAPQGNYQSNGGVVMQAVPFDPLAGPVKPVVHAPRAAVAKADIQPPKIDIIKPDAAPAARPAAPDTKAADAKPAANVKVADTKPTAPGKPQVKIDIKPDAVKALPVKAASKDQIPSLRMSANAY